MRAADVYLTDQRVAYGYSLLFYMLVYDIYMATGFVVMVGGKGRSIYTLLAKILTAFLAFSAILKLFTVVIRISLQKLDNIVHI